MKVEVHKDEDERSLGELFSDLTRETSALVRKEVELAKSEISQKAALVGKDIGMLVAGGLIAYAGLLVFAAFVVLLLASAGMSYWGSALLVGVVMLIIGGLLARAGISALKREDLAPRKTLETLKEDTQWMRELTRQ